MENLGSLDTLAHAQAALDAAIKQTQAFRMMGGLARLGSRAGAEYSHLVAKAQSMEKSVLGKILTSHTRAH